MKRQQTLIWIAILGTLFMMEAASYGEERVTVIIEKGTLAFSPQEVTIKKGDSIRWNNKAEEQHFLTASKSSEQLETLTRQSDLLLFKTMEKGEVYEKTFTDVGTFFYHCGIHAKMWGKITVEE